jgi:hypothetical protein
MVRFNNHWKRKTGTIIHFLNKPPRICPSVSAY